jgi:ribosomal protein S12 methylthiotransferase accessory factor YcaO
VQPLRARTEGSGALKIHDKSRWIPLIDVLKGEMNGLPLKVVIARSDPRFGGEVPVHE